MIDTTIEPTSGTHTLIPISIVTGFLGSGKTTLIGRVLRDPGFGRTAVIVNEFGEIGLDHDLIRSGDDSIVTLNTGCICCALQTDLARTLMDLHQHRHAGLVNYDRVLIETSGLSDPSSALKAMMTDREVSATHRMPFVVSLVDAVQGEKQLLEHAEAQHQVALADRLLISKTDLRPVSDQLVAELNSLNPDAPRATSIGTGASELFGDPSVAALTARLARTPRRAGHRGIETFAVVRERAIPALALTMLLQAVAEHCGSRMLRLKGLVAIDEMPGRPMVIHGVGHVINPPDYLDDWPGGDRTTRMIFITQGVPRHFIPRLLDAIDEEVRDAIAWNTK